MKNNESNLISKLNVDDFALAHGFDDWYKTVIKYDKQEIDLSIQADEKELSHPFLNTTNTICKSLATLDTQAKECAARDLLESANAGWYIEEDEEGNEIVLTNTTFKELITLISIGVISNNDYYFVYNDGGIFGDNRIIVSGNTEKGIEIAEME